MKKNTNQDSTELKDIELKDIRPKPSPRQWARWAGYNCGE